MTGGESVHESLRLLYEGWDSIQVRHRGQTMLLSEIDDELMVARQVLSFIATRHLPPDIEEAPDMVSGASG